ncbi:MAG: efflux RND transporter periplasmic adaptor subunit [Kiloniellales bacterium]|nr:efflux RND transporter periplasmic adaptor subunit [Kiloniellales bacterium]
MRTRARHPSRSGRAAAVACGLLVLALAGCEEKKQAALPPPPPKVVLAEVSQETVPIVLQASGTIKAVKNVKIIPRVSGYIFERYFTEGTFVDQDDPLYLIDPRPFEDRLQRLQEQLKGQEASLEFWQSEEKRYSKLAKQGAGSVEDAEGARAKFLTTQADIAATKVEIRNAELDVSYTRINAPFHGRIQQTLINVGNLVQAQQDVLTSLVMMDPIYVTFRLSRSQVFEIQKLRRGGQAFEVKDMIVEVVLPDGQLFQKKGKVDFVSTEIDPSTDSVTVRGILDNPKNNELSDFDLFPGQYVPVRLTIGEQREALVIPQTAVVETQAGRHVYVVGQDNKAELRMLKLGATHGTKWVVSEGLKAGEHVVAEGVQKVKSGVEVEPIKPNAETGNGEAKSEPSQAAKPSEKQ